MVLPPLRPYGRKGPGFGFVDVLASAGALGHPLAGPKAELFRRRRLVQQYELPGIARQPLRADTLNGMFKGFIDLVFEHQGRYYVADYKSNWLGSDDGAYTREAMEVAIASHRYDLQYVLYVLALHRQLRLRLPDYEHHPQQQVVDDQELQNDLAFAPWRVLHALPQCRVVHRKILQPQLTQLTHCLPDAAREGAT